MLLASLRRRPAQFDDERLKQKIKIATLKNESVDIFIDVSLNRSIAWKKARPTLHDILLRVHVGR